MLRRKRSQAAIAIIILVPIVIIAWRLLSPLFISKTVDEEFPFAAAAVVAPNMERADVEKAMAGMAMVDDTVTEPMPSQKGTNADAGKMMDGPMLDKITEAMAKTMVDAVGDAMPNDMPESDKQAMMQDMAEDHERCDVPTGGISGQAEGGRVRRPR